MSEERKLRNPKFAFVKFCVNLSCMFDAEEVVFLLHLVDIAYLRSKGYNTTWSKKYLMKRMNIRLRTFDRCTIRMIELGLLERRYQKGMYDYVLDMELYYRLIRFLSTTTDTDLLRSFCQENFVQQKRTIQSLCNKDIEILEKGNRG